MKKSATQATDALPARERILATAHRLFYGQGIRATGIDRLIAESHVTKVTFYRHFPSKNDLILEYLQYRHDYWMAWFDEALKRNGNCLAGLAPALAEWFKQEGFRGCAFINSVGELGETFPEVLEVTRRHKQEVISRIEALMPSSDRRADDAQAIALMVDGAIIRAQYDPSPKKALLALERMLQLLERA